MNSKTRIESQHKSFGLSPHLHVALADFPIVNELASFAQSQISYKRFRMSAVSSSYGRIPNSGKFSFFVAQSP